MSTGWYEIFDDTQVHPLVLRQRLHRSLTLTLGALFVLACAWGWSTGLLSPSLSLFLIGAVGFSEWVQLRNGRKRLRGLVWSLQLSPHCLVGYNYLQRKIVLPWKDIDRVALNAQGLTIQGPDTVLFEIPSSYPEFPTLSHRIVTYADTYEVPIFIDGMPWQQISVYRLFPFLERDLSIIDPSDPAEPSWNG
jgi:hypothetical protein